MIESVGQLQVLVENHIAHLYLVASLLQALEGGQRRHNLISHLFQKSVLTNLFKLFHIFLLCNLWLHCNFLFCEVI
jgi:hypothetical protein